MQTKTDMLATIDRELAKRATTYPKLIEKKKRQNESTRKIQNELDRQTLQLARLRSIRLIIKNEYTIDAYSAEQCLVELEREMKMRQRFYKRFVSLKRITQFVADEQIKAWYDLIEYWKTTYGSEYTETEQNCKGCFGPCGRCEEK